MLRITCREPVTNDEILKENSITKETSVCNNEEIAEMFWTHNEQISLGKLSFTGHNEKQYGNIV